MPKSFADNLRRNSHELGNRGPGITDVVGCKFALYPGILCNELKTLVHSPTLGFVFMKMLGAAVIIGGMEIVLGLLSINVKLQDVFQAFFNPSREEVARFILIKLTYKYLRYSLDINRKPLVLRLICRANLSIVAKFRLTCV
tara:strand:- start:306 stop:731 length:426 start_codon:yes stop_codon:yes gene_type:complete